MTRRAIRRRRLAPASLLCVPVLASILPTPARATGDDDFPGRRLDTPGLAARVEIAGDLAYVADKSAGLVIISVEDPAAFEIVGRFPTPDANGVDVEGGIAYVADGHWGLVLVDVRDPKAPALLSTPNHCMSFDVAVSGRYAHVAVHGGLQIFDVALPESPGYIGDVDWPTVARAVVVAEPYAYYACGRRGVRIFDIRDPARPALAGEIDTPGVPHDLYLAGDHLFVADGTGGLQVLDVSDPLAARIVGAAPTAGFATGIVVSGLRAYVGGGAAGLEVFDVSTPVAPIPLTLYTTARESGGVGVYGDDIVVADGEAGIVVLDSRADSNMGPRCDAGGPYTGVVGQRIRFLGRGSRDPDGTLTSYDWQFGDGAAGDGPDPTHAYAEPGLYFVRLCVADDDGIVSCCESPVELRVTPIAVVLAVEERDGHVHLVWEAGDAESVAGFLVHRRAHDEETFRRLTVQPIPADGARSWTFDDHTIERPGIYSYRVEAVATDGGRVSAERTLRVEGAPAVPGRLALHAPAPNPFNPATTIAFDLPLPAAVRLTVFDVAGRRVRDVFSGRLPAARHRFSWDGRDDGGMPAGAGLYVVQLAAGREVRSRKVALVE